MKNLILIFLLFLCINGISQNKQIFNLGFETQSFPPKLSDNWIKFGNYDISIDTISNSGVKSGKISSNTKGKIAFISNSIPSKYKGKKVILNAYMKLDNVRNGFAGLAITFNDGEKLISYKNMNEENISGTIDWKKYSISLDYPKGADNILISGYLRGEGVVWFDDFEILIDGKPIQQVEEIKSKAYKKNEFIVNSRVVFPELTPQLVNDIELLGKVWGFLKYYHPQVAKGKYDWDSELFRFLPIYIQDSKNNREELLINWISELGKVKECRKCKKINTNAYIKPDLEWISKSISNETLKAKLQYVYNNRNQGKNFYVKKHLIFGKPIFTNEKAYEKINYPDEGYRILALFRYWNTIQYYFPSKHLTDNDWQFLLQKYIPIFLNAQSEIDYELAAIQLFGEINDTHAFIRNCYAFTLWKGYYISPAKLQFIENILIVSGYNNIDLKSQSGLEIGDIITKIDGKPIDKIISDKSKYYPASNISAQLRNMSKDMLRSPKKELSIEYINNGITKTKVLKLYTLNEVNKIPTETKNNEKCYKMLDNNIGYITLETVKSSDIRKMKKEFINTQGIIIDIRNYPATPVVEKLSSFFVSKTTPYAIFSEPDFNNAGSFNYCKPNKLRNWGKTYKGKVIVLVNEETQSRAEFTTMAIRAGDNTTIIGSQTAGADGDITKIVMPG